MNNLAEIANKLERKMQLIEDSETRAGLKIQVMLLRHYDGDGRDHSELYDAAVSIYNKLEVERVPVECLQGELFV